MSFWDSYYGQPRKRKARRKIITVGGRKYVNIGSVKRSKPRRESSSGYSYAGYPYPSSKGEHISASDLYYGGKGAYIVGKKIAKSGPVQSLKRRIQKKPDNMSFKSTNVSLGRGTTRSYY